MTFLPTTPSTVRRRQLALAWSATDPAPTMLRVAFATHDRCRVNQHFGAATGFAFYAIDGERARLVGVAEFPEESMDGNESKLAAKITALAGCAAVYCLAVGGSAVRQLLAGGIQPVRLDAPEAIESLCAQLRLAVRDGGVPWVDKALRGQAAATAGVDRFAHMSSQEWQE